MPEQGKLFRNESNPIALEGGLRLHVLGSGSKGNCALIEGPQGVIMIDAGFSKKGILARMEVAGISPSRIKGIVITHEHSDHVKGIGVISRYLHVPIYATEKTGSYRTVAKEVACHPIHSRDHFEIAGIQVTSFPTSHDAAQPIGFRFEADGDAIGYCTDNGKLSAENIELLGDTRILALESNHDTHMLETGPYPYMLKKRIASNEGHLSNAQALAGLHELVTSRTEIVVGMHLSETNNTPDASVVELAHYMSEPQMNTTCTLASDAKCGLTITAAGQNRPLSAG